MQRESVSFYGCHKVLIDANQKLLGLLNTRLIENRYFLYVTTYNLIVM